MSSVSPMAVGGVSNVQWITLAQITLENQKVITTTVLS